MTPSRAAEAHGMANGVPAAARQAVNWDAEALALHRALVSTPSISGSESAAAERVAAWLLAHGVPEVAVLGASVLARVAATRPGAVAPRAILFNSHLDTVPPAQGWKHDPLAATREGARIYGLGANDAKASVAAMAAAVACFATERDGDGDGEREADLEVWLALVEGEETRGEGSQKIFADLADRGVALSGVVVGEPTGLDIAVAQKGLLILELVAHGTACHAAHAQALGATNALRELARALVALERVDLESADPWLGTTTLEPTVVRGGEVHNSLPAEAVATIDLRTVPSLPHAEMIERVRAQVAAATSSGAVEVRVRSDRLRPRATGSSESLVRAAQAARRAARGSGGSSAGAGAGSPEARLYGSPTLSDMAFAPPEVPTIKVGPGRSERSHTPDEFVEEQEILEGLAFYRALLREFARRAP